MTNGYIVLTKGDAKLYQHAVEAINLGKPIYYADGNKVAFVNSIELDSTNVVIKISDKQITVASNGTETELSLKEYTHHIILQLSVTGDNTTDMYACLNIKNNDAEDMNIIKVQDYIDKFSWSSDALLMMTAVGDRAYVGIGKDGDDYVAVTGDNQYVITELKLYSDTVL